LPFFVLAEHFFFVAIARDYPAAFQNRDAGRGAQPEAGRAALG
jgi:hypothetical protein